MWIGLVPYLMSCASAPKLAFLYSPHVKWQECAAVAGAVLNTTGSYLSCKISCDRSGNGRHWWGWCLASNLVSDSKDRHLFLDIAQLTFKYNKLEGSDSGCTEEGGTFSGKEIRNCKWKFLFSEHLLQPVSSSWPFFLFISCSQLLNAQLSSQ